MTDRFSVLQRSLHWIMVPMVLAMLFIGVDMVSTVAPRYGTLVSIHRPLGITILLLALVRLVVRLASGVPPLPAGLAGWQVFAARTSHVLLYALMLMMPLLGWAMLSAGGYPIVLYGALHLPPITPHSDYLHAMLWDAHAALAYLFFLTILLHLSAALLHAWVRRDDVFSSMAPWP